MIILIIWINEISKVNIQMVILANDGCTFIIIVVVVVAAVVTIHRSNG